MQVTGESVPISAISYDFNSGIATITSSGNHGLSVDESVEFVGAGQAQYNGNFVVTQNNSLTQFAVNMGTGTTNPTASGTIYAYREGYAANGGVITVEDENLTGRQVPTYAGLTTTLSAAISNTSTTTVSLTNQSSGNNDVNIGDYLIVDNEMMRVKTTVTDGDSSVSVFLSLIHI